MAAPSHVNTQGSSAAGGINLTLPALTGLADGDLIVCVACVDSSQSSAGGVTAAGATKNTYTNGSTLLVVSTVVWHTGDSTAITFVGPSTTAHAIAAVAQAWRNVHSSVDDATRTTASATGTNPDCAAITPAHNDSAILAVVGSSINDTAITAPTNYSLDASAVKGIHRSSNDSSVYLAYRILSGGAGVSEDPPAFTNVTYGVWAGVTMALRSQDAIDANSRSFAAIVGL